MPQTRADEATLRQVRDVLADAAQRGHDPAEALDRAGLLWFSQRVHEVRRLTLVDLAEVLDEIQVKVLASVQQQRMPSSPLDAKRLIVGWLRLNAEGAK